jgi:outer membrane protein assembly factor BamB
MRLLASVLLLAAAATAARADDWPQWMGPTRDDHWVETGITRKFPEGGAKIQWRTPVAGGYSGPAVAAGRVFVFDYTTDGNTDGDPGRREKLSGVERILCLNAETGQPYWQHQYDQTYEISYPVGPRCTPTVDGDRVYALGAEGRLTCLYVADGKVAWEKDFKAAYGATTPFWGYANHPLVWNNLLFCVVGGEKSLAVAFDKKTGKEQWRALSAKEQAYCPPTMISVAGQPQLLIWDAEALNSLEPSTGKALWSVPLACDFGMSIMAPRQSGKLLFASGIVGKGLLLELQGTKQPEIVYRVDPTLALSSVNSTPIIDGETMYGVDRKGELRGIELSTGKRLWETFVPTTGERRENSGTAFLVKNGDCYFLMSETGDLVIARLTPTGYQELSRAHILEPTSTAFGRHVVWSHPAFANRHVYARNDKEILSVDLAE